jgi:hypothetical protein
LFFVIYIFGATSIMTLNQFKRPYITIIAAAVCCQLVCVGNAWADRDVFLANVGGKVAVGSAADTSPARPDLVTRVFTRVMVPSFPPVNPPDYGLDEPGYFALPAGDAEIPPGASALPGNASVYVNLLPFTINGNTAALFYWNGSGPVDFQPIALSQPGVSLTIDPNPIGNTGATGGADIHPSYRLDNGGAGLPADGLYLTSATVGVPGLTDSPRIFLLNLVEALVTDEADAEELFEGLETGETMFKGKDFAFFNMAQDYVQTNLVPEATTLVLAMLTIAPLCVVRRRSLTRTHQ